MRWFPHGLALIAALCGTALADAPKGRYRLEIGGFSDLYTPEMVPIPSCGQRARDFIANLGRLNLEKGTDVRVNGTVWKPAAPSSDMEAVGHVDLLEGFYVQINFARARRFARGRLTVTRISGERFADAVRLSGSYTR